MEIYSETGLVRIVKCSMRRFEDKNTYYLVRKILKKLYVGQTTTVLHFGFLCR